MSGAILRWPSFMPHETDGDLWVVTALLKVRLANGTVLTLLEGFESDGESGPEALKALLTSKDNRRLIAAMLHDSLYQARMLKEWADQVYHEVLGLLGVSAEDCLVLFQGVDEFAGEAYAEDGKDPVKIAAATDHLRIEILSTAGS